MTTDPGHEPPKSADVCPKCKEPIGSEHKRDCGLWSPYSTSKWVKAKPEKSAPTAWPVLTLQNFLDRVMGAPFDAEGRN